MSSVFDRNLLIVRLLTWIQQLNKIMQGEDKLKGLSDAIKVSDHNAIYNFSKELLKEQPDDLDFQQCHILSSIKLGRGEEAAQQYFKQPPSDPSLQLLYAYSFYDRGQFQKTIAYINSLKNHSSLKLLLAQAHFRAFNYHQSAELMLSLLKESNLMEEEKEEYIINLMATGFNRALSHEIVTSFEKLIVSAERKELLFNYALMMFQCGQFQKCFEFLRQFEGTLVEGRDTDDLAAVRLFRDYAEWNSDGKFGKGVNEVYEQMLRQISNKNVKGVIYNNMLFFRQGQQIQHTHEVLRMFDECLEDDFKMTEKQRNIVYLNKLAVFLRKGKYSEAQKLIKELDSKGQLTRDQHFVKCKYFFLKKSKDADLQSYIRHVSSFDEELGYCLRVDSEKEKGAETDLIADIRMKGKEVSHPIIKNYLFSLLIKHSTLFEQYSQYLSEMAEMTNDSNIIHILLNIYENKQDLARQKQLLIRLQTLQPKEPQVKVKLAKIYLSEKQIQKAEDTLRGVETPEELPDIAYLQFIQKNMHVSIKKEEEAKDDNKINPTVSKKRIKKKKARLPKNIDKFIPNFKGDPERWIPKWQRKGYRKKGKKGTGKTQGLSTIGRQEKNVFAAGSSTSNREVTKDMMKKKK